MSVRRALDEALRLYNQGKIPAAAKLTAQIVAARPRLPEGQNLLGVILAAQGKKAEAVKAMSRATRWRLQRTVSLQPRASWSASAASCRRRA